jgi:hypothetical protein
MDPIAIPHTCHKRTTELLWFPIPQLSRWKWKVGLVLLRSCPGKMMGMKVPSLGPDRNSMDVSSLTMFNLVVKVW